MPHIKFLKSEKIFQVASGTEFLEFFQNHPEAPFKFGCKRGECGVCAANICDGKQNLTKPSAEETSTLNRKNLDNNYRLLCQCAINGDVLIDA